MKYTYVYQSSDVVVIQTTELEVAMIRWPDASGVRWYVGCGHPWDETRLPSKESFFDTRDEAAAQATEWLIP